MKDDKYLIATITGVTGAGLGYLIYKATRPPVEIPEKPEEVVVTIPTPTPEKPVVKGMVTISESIADLITSGTTTVATIFDRITEFATKPKPKPEVVEAEIPTAPEEPLPTKPTEPTTESKVTVQAEGRDFRICSYKGDRRATCYKYNNEQWVLYKDKANKYHKERRI